MRIATPDNPLYRNCLKIKLRFPIHKQILTNKPLFFFQSTRSLWIEHVLEIYIWSFGPPAAACFVANESLMGAPPSLSTNPGSASVFDRLHGKFKSSPENLNQTGHGIRMLKLLFILNTLQLLRGKM